MKAVQPHLTRTDIPSFTATSGELGCGLVQASVRLLRGHQRTQDRFEIIVVNQRDPDVLGRDEATALMVALQAALMAEGDQ